MGFGAPEGDLCCPNFRPFKWTQASSGFLQFVFEKVWASRLVSASVKLERLFHVDTKGVKKSLASYHGHKLGILKTHCCGSHFTNDVTSKWSTTGATQLPPV